MIQTLLLNNGAVSEDDNSPIHSTVQSLFEDNEGELKHVPCPAKSPDLNIVKPLWSVLETRVRKRFPLPTSLKQLKGVLQEEWYKISLQTTENLYEFIPRRIEAILKARWFNTILIKKHV
jgi:hypothetical protein